MIGWAPEAARKHEEGEWGCVLASKSLSALALHMGISHEIKYTGFIVLSSAGRPRLTADLVLEVDSRDRSTY